MKKIKTKYIIIVFLLCLNIILPQNRWQFVNPLPTGFNLYNVNKDSYNNLWVIGEFGTILKSVDNGDTWETIAINYTENLYDSEIINEKIWIVGQNGLIIYSNNLGFSWIKQTINTKKSLLKIQFIDENHGWIMASDSLVFRTEDGGINWQQIRINNIWPLNDLTFINKDKGFLLSGYYNQANLDVDPWTAGELFKTNDGGLTWLKADSGDTKYSSIFFLNDQIGFMSVHNLNIGRMLLKTTDSGNNWDTLSNSFVWDQIYFTDEQNGIAIGGYFLGKTTDGGLNWEIKTEINTPSLSSKLKSIYPNDQNLFIVGTEGNILRSNDFGENWNRLNSTINFYYASLRGVTFANRNIGYIYGDQYLEYPNHKPILLSTVDGGKTWNNLLSPDSNYVSILKVYNNILWASSNTKLFRSDNNGTSWIEIIDVSINNDEQIRDIFLFNNQHIVLLAGRRVYQSTDGGSNWSNTTEFGVAFLKQFIRITENKWIILGHSGFTEPNYITENSGLIWTEFSHKFTTMQFLNENIGYAIDSSLYKTTNGGITWELINQSLKDIAYWTSRLYFYNESVGWLNSSDFLYHTKDGGSTWVKEYGIKSILNWNGPALSIISETEAWAVGSNGHIFKLTPGSFSNVEVNNLKIPRNINLFQNYPNPFNPSTIISYLIPSVGTSHDLSVQLKVFDVLGKEVATLVNEEKPAGTYEVKFNANRLTSGVYFYTLTAGNFIQTKKMILLR